MTGMLLAQANPPQIPMSTLFWLGIITVGVIALLGGIFITKYFNLWIQAFLTHANVSIMDLVRMSFRKVNASIMVRSKIMAVQSGITEVYPISTRNLEAHYLAGGNVPRVVQALIAAHRAKIQLDWRTAAAIDLAGRNILEAVQTSVYPKVIDCPDPKQSAEGTLSAVCGDGIELRPSGIIGSLIGAILVTLGWRWWSSRTATSG